MCDCFPYGAVATDDGDAAGAGGGEEAGVVSDPGVVDGVVLISGTTAGGSDAVPGPVCAISRPREPAGAVIARAIMNNDTTRKFFIDAPLP